MGTSDPSAIRFSRCQSRKRDREDQTDRVSQSEPMHSVEVARLEIQFVEVARRESEATTAFLRCQSAECRAAIPREVIRVRGAGSSLYWGWPNRARASARPRSLRLV